MQAGAAAGEEGAAQAALVEGLAARERGEVRAADGALRQALAAEPGPLLRSAVLRALGELSLDVGDDLPARGWLEEAEALARDTGGALSAEAGRCLLLRGRLHRLADQDPARAAACWERARRLLEGEEQAQALHSLGQVRLELGEVGAAQDALEAALAGCEGDALRAEVLVDLARLRSAQGQHERALDLARQRVALVHALYGPQSMPAADTLLLLAGLAEAGQDLESAVSALDRAVLVLTGLLGADHDETAMAAAYLLALQGRLLGAPPPPR